MPELPEVETIVSALRDGRSEYRTSVVGLKIKDTVVLWSKTLAAPSEEEFRDRIREQTVTGLSRRGKFLIFSLASDHLLIHLRMSGDLRLEDASDEIGSPKPFEKHDRLALNFTEGSRLVFNDTRKFGRVWLVKDPAEITGELGLEPLDESFTAQQFHQMLIARGRLLKPLLMDQTFIAGLGNIYTDEALHLAKLHPLTQSKEITQDQSGRLLEAIRAVLNEGIQRNGASIDWVYRGGDFQNYFRVYGRTGEPCPVCGTPIERLVVGQRGTHICPNCQALH
jgi:formamidopyrimidine-DNA glycosylase